MTFADLMGLLVAFFVMLVAFSTQDQKKLQIVAGSMREAFGVQTEVRRSGVVEAEGLTALVSTHDPVMMELADRVIHIADGQLTP